MEREREKVAYFLKAHGTEFVYFACVLGTGNRGACINMRPEPRRLFEHLLVLLVLCEEHKRHKVSVAPSTAQNNWDAGERLPGGSRRAPTAAAQLDCLERKTLQ